MTTKFTSSFINRTVSIIITVYLAGLNVLADDNSHWDSWKHIPFTDCIAHKSQNIELCILQDEWRNKYKAARNASDYDGTIYIMFPPVCLLEPLKPFQFELSLRSFSRPFDIEFTVKTSMGEQKFVYSDPSRLGEREFGSYNHLTISYEVIKTLTIECEYGNNSKKILKQFHSVTEINPITLRIKPHSAVIFGFDDNLLYRIMNVYGIETRALAAAEMYQNKEQHTKAIEILNTFIDSYKYTFSAKAYMYRAISHLEKDNIDQALKDINSSIDLSPCEFAYFVRGYIKIEELGDFSGVDDMRKSGTPGKDYLDERGLVDGNFSAAITDNHLGVPESIIKTLIPTRKNILLTSKQIYNKYNPSVFMVYTQGIDGISQGSGFFIGKDGLAISNYHVFKGAINGKEQIKLMNGGTYKVKEIIGYDKEKDFIIFRVEGTGFSYIPITKRGYEIGDEVYAIGSPKGMQNTISNGLVSQKWDNNRFQISVPIDHGSSGGALLNKYGEVIGITSGGLDDTHANLNYAIDIRAIFDDVE